MQWHKYISASSQDTSGTIVEVHQPSALYQPSRASHALAPCSIQPISTKKQHYDIDNGSKKHRNSLSAYKLIYHYYRIINMYFDKLNVHRISSQTWKLMTERKKEYWNLPFHLLCRGWCTSQYSLRLRIQLPLLWMDNQTMGCQLHSSHTRLFLVPSSQTHTWQSVW